VLASNSEETAVSFWHVLALCLVSPQVPQRRRVKGALSGALLLQVFFDGLATNAVLAAT
jgi:hypothetical protein